MERNNKVSTHHAVQSIQKIWRGYLGRKLITRIQLHNERDKLKLSRYQKTLKKKLINDNMYEEKNSAINIQEKETQLSEIDDIIVYKVSKKKSSKLGTYDGSNYNSKNHIDKLHIINNNSSFQLPFFQDNKQFNQYKNNEIKIPFEFAHINNGLLSNIEEEDEDLLRDSLHNTAVLLDTNQSQQHVLKLNQSIKSIDSLEMDINSNYKISNLITYDDINLEDSLNFQQPSVINKTNQMIKNYINTIPSLTNQSSHFENNLYNQNENQTSSPQRKTIRIANNNNILLDTSQNNNDSNQPKIPSMQDLLALSPMKSIPLLLSPNKDKNKLISNIPRIIKTETQINNPFPIPQQQQVQYNLSDKLKHKSQLEIAQETYESNVRNNFPKINPQPITATIPSSPNKSIHHLQQSNESKLTIDVSRMRKLDGSLKNELQQQHRQQFDTIESNQLPTNTYQLKMNNQQQQYQPSTQLLQGSEELNSNLVRTKDLPVSNDIINRNRNKSIMKGYLNQMNAPISKEQLSDHVVKPNNNLINLDSKDNIERPPLLKPYDKNINNSYNNNNIIKPTPVSGLNIIDQQSKAVNKKFICPLPLNNPIIPNKSNNKRLDQSTFQELQELKLLQEIDQLNKIQLQKMKELSFIEQQEQKYIKIDVGNINDLNKNINEKYNKIKEIDPIKDKEKKAFGPGARDIKPSKPLLITTTKQISNKNKRIITTQQQQQYQNEILSNNNNNNNNILQNPSNVVLHEWQNALIKENENNKALISDNSKHIINELYNNAGIGYLQEYHKKRENKQRNLSNPRNNIERNGYVDHKIYDNNSITKSEDVRLFQHKSKEKHQLVGRNTQQNHIEETMSLPTILPNRNMKSSNGFIISSQYADMIDPMQAHIGQNSSNRNTTMSAPSSHVCNNNNPPLFILPTLKNFQQQPSNMLPMLAMPIANRKLAK